MANELAAIPGIDINPDTVDTNIVIIKIQKEMWKKLRTDHRIMAG